MPEPKALGIIVFSMATPLKSVVPDPMSVPSILKTIVLPATPGLIVANKVTLPQYSTEGAATVIDEVAWVTKRVADPLAAVQSISPSKLAVMV